MQLQYAWCKIWNEFNIQGLISWSTTATGGRGLLEECKISSFCGSVADCFPVMKYKRRSFLKEKKNNEEEEEKAKVKWCWPDLIYTNFTLLHQ